MWTTSGGTIEVPVSCLIPVLSMDELWRWLEIFCGENANATLESSQR